MSPSQGDRFRSERSFHTQNRRMCFQIPRLKGEGGPRQRAG
jgi:hypothetical protein